MKYILLSVVLAFGSCAAWSKNRSQVAQGLYDDGVITAEQRDVLIGESSDAWLELLGTGLLSVLASLGIVKGWRGGIETRKGSAPPQP